MQQVKQRAANWLLLVGGVLSLACLGVLVFVEIGGLEYWSFEYPFSVSLIFVFLDALGLIVAGLILKANIALYARLLWASLGLSLVAIGIYSFATYHQDAASLLLESIFGFDRRGWVYFFVVLMLPIASLAGASCGVAGTVLLARQLLGRSRG